jgi:hypothetical protein
MKWLCLAGLPLSLLGLLACAEERPVSTTNADASSPYVRADAGSPTTDAGSADAPDSADDATMDAAEDATIGDGSDDGSIDAPPDDAGCAGPLTTADAGSACGAIVQSWGDEGHTHVPEGTAVAYCTRPPSSGFHYPVWADYRTYDKPVAAPYLVHALEHGAVVITYRCATSCPAIASQLQSVIDARPQDPMCGGTIKSRIILAPDPSLDVAVGAAAWQWTYRASCVDASSLSSFIDAHYALAAENTCAPGVVPP